MNLSPFELKFAENFFKEISDQIEKEVQDYIQKLEAGKVILSNDYIGGYHAGDGCLTISIMFQETTLKDGTKTSKLSASPNWNIVTSRDSEALCRGFQARFKKGYVHVGTSKCTFKLSGWKTCVDLVIPLLSTSWLSGHRRQQLNDFKTCCELAVQKTHFSEEGFTKFLDAVWDFNYDGKFRRKTKEQILAEAKIHFAQRKRKA